MWILETLVVWDFDTEIRQIKMYFFFETEYICFRVLSQRFPIITGQTWIFKLIFLGLHTTNSPGLMWLSCLCWLPRQPHDKKANPISSLLGEPDVRCTAPWVQPTCFFKSSFNDMLLLSSMTLEKSDFSLMKSEPKCVGHTEDKRKETSKGHLVNKSWRKRFWLK